MFKKIFPIMILCLAITSCLPNKNILHNPSKLWKKTINKSYSKKIYYFDSVGYYNLMKYEDLSNLKSLVYGVFVSDSILKVPKEINSSENPMCIGIMLKEIEKEEFYLTSDSSIKRINKYFLTQHLMNILSKQPIILEEYKNKSILVLLFSVEYGILTNTFYKKAIKYTRNKNIPLIIVSMDPLYYKSKS